MLWGLRLQPMPQVTPQLLVALLPVALFHTVGHVSACVSFSQMAVSFTHIVKVSGMEPRSIDVSPALQRRCMQLTSDRRQPRGNSYKSQRLYNAVRARAVAAFGHSRH